MSFKSSVDFHRALNSRVFPVPGFGSVTLKTNLQWVGACYDAAITVQLRQRLGPVPIPVAEPRKLMIGREHEETWSGLPGGDYDLAFRVDREIPDLRVRGPIEVTV